LLRKSLLVMLPLALVLGTTGAPAAAQTVVGVTATEIKIGNTNRYSGPAYASIYATMGKVVGAYFRKVNDEGGVNGRKLRFLSYDDGYHPRAAMEQVRKLVEQDQVALLFQTVGTQANATMHEYVNAKKVPHLFVTSGSSKWNDPGAFPWTMGWQLNYQTEGRIYAQYIRRHLPNARIGILYQNDSYGRDYRKGLLDGLGEAASKLVVLEQAYEPGDASIEDKIVKLRNSGANVLYNVAWPRLAEQAIEKARDIGWEPTHLLNSVSMSAMKEASEVSWHPRHFWAALSGFFARLLRPDDADVPGGVVTAFYQKQVSDPRWKTDQGYVDWVAFMRKYYPEGSLDDQLNAFGYLVAQTLVHVLEQCGSDLSRENIMRQAARIKNLELAMLLPGVRINTSPTDFAPIEQARLARFDGERWVLFGDVYDASRN
jgi:branched-chain amino acid transport system substrate-binding protein